MKYLLLLLTLFSQNAVSQEIDILWGNLWQRRKYETPPPGHIQIIKNGKEFSVDLHQDKFQIEIEFEGKTERIDLELYDYFRGYRRGNYNLEFTGEGKHFTIERLKIEIKQRYWKLKKFTGLLKKSKRELTVVRPYDDSYKPRPNPRN